MESVRIDVEGIQDTINLLRKIEPESLKELRRDIKNDPGLAAAASSVRSQVPPLAPLSGMMNHDGDSQYKIPKVTTSFKSPRRMFTGESSLVSIVVTSPKGSYGFEMADMAGRGGTGRSPRGKAFLRNLAAKASRYVYPGFEKREEAVELGVKRILEKYAEKVNVKLKVM